MRRMIIPVLLITAFGFYFVPKANAYPVTIQIEAVVDTVKDTGNYLEGKINPGNIITGYYTYESTTPDSIPEDPVVGHYRHSASPAGAFLTVGGFYFQTDPANVDFLVGIVNNGTSGGLHDGYWFTSYNNLAISNGNLVDLISWSLEDPTANAFLNDSLPTTSPVLDDWQSIVGLRLEGDRTFLINAHVISAIPEPATFLLLGLGGLMLRKIR